MRLIAVPFGADGVFVTHGVAVSHQACTCGRSETTLAAAGKRGGEREREEAYITAQLEAPAPAAAALKRFVWVTVHFVNTPPAE